MSQRVLPTVLFILKVAPPIGGTTLMNELIDGIALKPSNLFKSFVIRQRVSDSISEHGRFSVRKLIRGLLNLNALVRVLLRKRIDIVYLPFSIHGFALIKDAIAVVLCKIFSQHVILHIHAKLSVTKWEAWILGWCLQNSYVIVPAPQMVENLVPWQQRLAGPVIVLPNGVQIVEYPEQNQGINKRQTPLKILYLSNLARFKGLEDLIHTMRILDGEPIELEIRGFEGDISPKLLDEWIRSQGLTNNVCYKGGIVGHDKSQLYSQFDLFVHPSHFETFGLVLIEAMQAGLPIITTNVGGIPSVITHNETGWLVPAKDPVALAEAIRYLHDRPDERKRLGENAKRDFHRRFTLETFESNFLHVMDSILVNTLSK